MISERANGPEGMTFTTAHVSISLDGFVAGPDQSMDDPVGRGGMALHRWHSDAGLADRAVDQYWSDRLQRPRGAYLMGRNMYGPVRGSWSSMPDWRGWWGDEPPYHAPVFVLTHHAHDPVPLGGGTTFHFVTDGFAAALERAREVGNGDVHVAGGASTVRQALAAGVIDELTLDLAPLLLGDGERLFDGISGLVLEPVEIGESAFATHLRYRVSAPPATR